MPTCARPKRHYTATLSPAFRHIRFLGRAQVWHPANLARSRGLRENERPVRDRFRSREVKGRDSSKQITPTRGLVYSISSDAPHRIREIVRRRRSRQCHLSCRARHRSPRRDPRRPCSTCVLLALQTSPESSFVKQRKQDCIFRRTRHNPLVLDD